MKNILLVEDEYLIAQAEKLGLQAEGYSVTHVGRGEDAVSAALAPDADFDIVLMDVNLGAGIDGPEAARRILAERDLPVIFLSSHTEKQVVELTRGVGSYGYIPKSAGSAVLNASLRMAFQLAQANAQLREREAVLAVSERKYRNLFESMQEGFALHEAVRDDSGRMTDYVFLDVNPAFERLTGLRKPDILGRRILEIQPTLEPEWILDYASVVDTGVPKRIRRLSGALDRFYAVDAFRAGDNRFACFFTDVTAETLAVRDLVEKQAELEDTVVRMKRLEDSLRRELEVNDSLGIIAHEIFAKGLSAQSAADVVLREARKLIRTEHGYVSRVDAHTGDNIGYTLTRMMERGCEVEGPGHRIAFPRGPDGLYSGLYGYSLNTREPLIANDPASHPASKGIPPGHVPIRNFLGYPIVRNGALIGQIALANKKGPITPEDLEVVGRIADLYGLLLSRVDQEGTERLLARILTTAEEAVIVLDLAGRVRSWNPSAERIFGKQAGAVLGREADFLPPEGQALTDRLARIAAARDPVRESLVLEGPEGRRFPALLTWSPIENDDGLPEAVSLVVSERASDRADT